MLKLVKQFFALSLCLLMLLPFASAAFVDPGNTVTPCDAASCGHPDYCFEYEGIQDVDHSGSIYCLGSFVRFYVYRCQVCGGQKYYSDDVEDHRTKHDYSGGVVRCNNCGWIKGE